MPVLIILRGSYLDFSAFFYDNYRGMNKERCLMMKIYCCEEHVDIALDTIVDELYTIPLFTKIDVDKLSTTCEYCQKPAVYMVGNE